MRSPLPPRDPQRGNSLVLALIVMSALATLGSLTVVSMQSSIQLSTNDRAQAIAMYAAESGAAVTMVALRNLFDPAPSPGWTAWSNYLSANNTPPYPPITPLVPSSGARPGNASNLFDRDQNAWYEIVLLNNRNDPSFGAGNGTNDTDGIVIIRSTGHGPQGSLAIVEWTVQRVGFWGSVQPGGTVVPPLPPVPPVWPPVAPNYWLFPPTFTDRTTPASPPSLTGGWGWVPTSPDFQGAGAPSFYNVGMVLLSWHIVSL
jgi:type II secretory pathway pseudopilin PulG